MFSSLITVVSLVLSVSALPHVGPDGFGGVGSSCYVAAKGSKEKPDKKQTCSPKLVCVDMFTGQPFVAGAPSIGQCVDPKAKKPFGDDPFIEA